MRMMFVTVLNESHPQPYWCSHLSCSLHQERQMDLAVKSLQTEIAIKKAMGR
jgi:hypothetical protein